MSQSSLHTWRSIIVVVFPGTGLFCNTSRPQYEQTLYQSTRESPPCSSALYRTYKTLQNNEHAMGILYPSPALCDESLCLAKHTAHAHASCCTCTPRSQPLASLGIT